MAHAYFADGVAAARRGDTLVVVGSEARHAITVARLRVGEQLTLLDGNGSRVLATVTSIDGGSFEAHAVEDASVTAAPEPRILLVQALAKGGRDEQALQAAVELGIDGVIPWQAQRSIVKWVGAKAEKQRERWQQIAREASKQSLRAQVPTVAEVVTTTALTAKLADATVCILDPAAHQSLRTVELPSTGTVALVVGPEGGIDEHELALLTGAGGISVRLGEHVLRTSTAGPAALAMLLTRLERW